MSEMNTPGEASVEAPKKKSKGMLFGAVGALIMGGLGFFVMYTGALDGLLGKGHAEAAASSATKNVTYLPLDPMIISLGPRANAQHLKFSAQLEVATENRLEVEALIPRIIDVLNTFLRIVDESELEDPTAMLKLRAQLLRRVQVVAGEGKVRDLLINEFVLN